MKMKINMKKSVNTAGMKRFIPALFLFCVPVFASTYDDFPNPRLTPGVVASTDTALVCEKDYPSRSRHVTSSTKNKVYERYGVDKALCDKGCKIDHLVPLSIGGANDIQNLWPHEYGADHNVYAKTRLEVRLRKEVCTGHMPIVDAQTCIKNNWIQCFDKFYKK